LSVLIERDIDVALVARLSGMSLEDFQQLNPQLKKPLILAAGTPQVLLPYDNANRFITNRALHQGPLASWTAWVVPRNLSAAQAARRLGISEVELRELNHIPPRMLIKGGSTLCRAPKSDDVAEHCRPRYAGVRAGLLPCAACFQGRPRAKRGRRGTALPHAGQLAVERHGRRFKAGQRIVGAASGQPARGGAKLVKSPSGKAAAAKVKGQRTVPRTTKATPPAKPPAARKRPR
jgi:membrane-bound lytic murein transglycosylase D